MTTEVLTVAVSVISAAVIAAAKPVLDWYNARKKSEGDHEERENKHELDITQQALSAYQSLIQTLTCQITKLGEDIRNMEQAHIKCQAENAEMRACVKSLEDKVDSLSQRLQKYENRS